MRTAFETLQEEGIKGAKVAVDIRGIPSITVATGANQGLGAFVNGRPAELAVLCYLVEEVQRLRDEIDELKGSPKAKRREKAAV